MLQSSYLSISTFAVIKFYCFILCFILYFHLVKKYTTPRRLYLYTYYLFINNQIIHYFYYISDYYSPYNDLFVANNFYLLNLYNVQHYNCSKIIVFFFFILFISIYKRTKGNSHAEKFLYYKLNTNKYLFIKLHNLKFFFILQNIITDRQNSLNSIRR